MSEHVLQRLDVRVGILGDSHRPHVCSRCNVSLPLAATNPLCDECIDVPECPTVRKWATTVVHNGSMSTDTAVNHFSPRRLGSRHCTQQAVVNLTPGEVHLALYAVRDLLTRRTLGGQPIPNGFSPLLNDLVISAH